MAPSQQCLPARLQRMRCTRPRLPPLGVLPASSGLVGSRPSSDRDSRSSQTGGARARGSWHPARGDALRSGRSTSRRHVLCGGYGQRHQGRPDALAGARHDAATQRCRPGVQRSAPARSPASAAPSFNSHDRPHPHSLWLPAMARILDSGSHATTAPGGLRKRRPRAAYSAVCLRRFGEGWNQRRPCRPC